MMNWLSRGALALTCIALLAACSQQAPPTNVAPVSTPSTQSNAVVVFTDPVTGEIRDPTEAELRAMAQAEQQKRATIEKTPEREIQLPDGSVATLHDPATEAPLKACIENDGQAVVDHACAESKAEAR